ncbi:hypothetical protein BD413DRAFT_90575 [Trametes elegans]|nr:hypothetical protein BD413DRAFT_90575 [Trametes elegans]
MGRPLDACPLSWTCLTKREGILYQYKYPFVDSGSCNHSSNIRLHPLSAPPSLTHDSPMATRTSPPRARRRRCISSQAYHRLTPPQPLNLSSVSSARSPYNTVSSKRIDSSRARPAPSLDKLLCRSVCLRVLGLLENRIERRAVTDRMSWRMCL